MSKNSTLPLTPDGYTQKLKEKIKRDTHTSVSFSGGGISRSTIFRSQMVNKKNKNYSSRKKGMK